MNYCKSARSFGISVILLTLLFRIFQLGIPQTYLKKQTIPLQIQTGREVRSFSSDFFFPFVAESSPPMDLPPEPEKPCLTGEDAESVALTDAAGRQPDIAALLETPLSWKLARGCPTVLILHTHATESYTKQQEDYTESAAYRTLDEGYNMLSIGDRVAEILEAAGVQVIHDRQLHDYPSYNDAYSRARKTIAARLAENPEISLVLDLHRDAADMGTGQLRTVTEVDGKDCAQLMLVMGCGNAGLSHPDWQKNLSLAVKLQAVLERQDPGICRPISLRSQRYNQDLCPGTLLVEVGAAGNSHEEAIRAAEKLAEAILVLQNGTAANDG